MKGPYERLKYDMRRLWECPKCHHKERTGITGTSCFCDCGASEDPPQPPASMKLIEDGIRRVR